MGSPQEAVGQLPGTACLHPYPRVLRSACLLSVSVSLSFSLSLLLSLFLVLCLGLCLPLSVSLICLCLSISLCLLPPGYRACGASQPCPETWARCGPIRWDQFQAESQV